MGGPRPLDYAAWRASALGRITERLERAAVIDLAGPVAGRDILDVGCGDGTYVVAFGTLGGRVIGLDASRRSALLAPARPARACRCRWYRAMPSACRSSREASTSPSR